MGQNTEFTDTKSREAIHDYQNRKIPYIATESNSANHYYNLRNRPNEYNLLTDYRAYSEFSDNQSDYCSKRAKAVIDVLRKKVQYKKRE